MNKMKRITAIIILILAILPAGAQDKKKDHSEWHKKMEAEKIAFFSSTIDLTSEEAQAFWPVYNRFTEEKDAAWHKVRTSFRALRKGLEENKPEKEIIELTKAYETAVRNAHEVESTLGQRFEGVLPQKKIAKIYIAEEYFRRELFKKLKNKNQ